MWRNITWLLKGHKIVDNFRTTPNESMRRSARDAWGSEWSSRLGSWLPSHVVICSVTSVLCICTLPERCPSHWHSLFEPLKYQRTQVRNFPSVGTVVLIPPLPTYMLPLLPTFISHTLLPTPLPSSLAHSSPASHPSPPSCAPILPVQPPLPSPSSLIPLRGPSYHPPTIPPLLASLHALLFCIRKSGSCLILFDIKLHCVSVCLFLFSLPKPLGSWYLRSACFSFCARGKRRGLSPWADAHDTGQTRGTIDCGNSIFALSSKSDVSDIQSEIRQGSTLSLFTLHTTPRHHYSPNARPRYSLEPESASGKTLPPPNKSNTPFSCCLSSVCVATRMRAVSPRGKPHTGWADFWFWQVVQFCFIYSSMSNSTTTSNLIFSKDIWFEVRHLRRRSDDIWHRGVFACGRVVFKHHHSRFINHPPLEKQLFF